MKKNDYFKGIAGYVSVEDFLIGRKKVREFSPEELEIYNRGKKDAFKSILIEMGTKQTFAEVEKRLKRMLKFCSLQKKTTFARLSTDTTIWERSLNYTAEELHDFVKLQIADIQSRLKKARSIHIANIKIIKELTQLQID